MVSVSLVIRERQDEVCTDMLGRKRTGTDFEIRYKYISTADCWKITRKHDQNSQYDTTALEKSEAW